MKLIALIFLVALAVARAESPELSTTTNLTKIEWDSPREYATNVLRYYIHHAGADGKMTNVDAIYGWTIGRAGLSYPARMVYTVRGASVGTNYFGVSARLQGGVATSTNKLRVILSITPMP